MTQRLIRILVYEGSPKFIQHCLAVRGVKGSYKAGEGIIKEAIVGDFLEEIFTRIPVETPKDKPDAEEPLLG